MDRDQIRAATLARVAATEGPTAAAVLAALCPPCVEVSHAGRRRETPTRYEIRAVEFTDDNATLANAEHADAWSLYACTPLASGRVEVADCLADFESLEAALEHARDNDLTPCDVLTLSALAVSA